MEVSKVSKEVKMLLMQKLNEDPEPIEKRVVSAIGTSVFLLGIMMVFLIVRSYIL